MSNNNLSNNENNNDKNVLIEIRDLWKVYTGPPKVEVLKGISLDIYSKEVIAITGESGSGKTTLLNIIGGIDNLTKGTVEINNHKIHKMSEAELAKFRNSNIGYVFQFHNLLGEFSALENVMIPFLMKDYNKKLALQKAEHLLEAVGLKDRATHRIGELSGGEAQRVAIARALINNPSVILADEPTGNLDKKNANSIQELLWNMASITNATLIIVTHSQSIASLANRKLRLEYGETLTEY